MCRYSNPGNPLAHYDDTAEEILFQTDGKIDMLVAGAGTGGTITGIARKLKEKVPNCVIVGADPFGSILAEPEELNGDANSFGPYKVEGIGYDFIPKVLDRSVIDKWIKTNDKDSFIMARDLLRLEGLLCGGSSGTAMWAAVQAAKDLGPNDRCVVVLPDSVRNYMSKFLDPAWMVDNEFLPAEAVYETPKEWWSDLTVADLHLATPVTVSPELTVSQCAALLKEHGFDQVPVVDKNQNILGVVTEGNIAAKLLAGRVQATDPITAISFPSYKKINAATKLGHLSHIFTREYYALVCSTQKNFGPEGVTEREVISGIVTRIDLLNFIFNNKK
jgi:cystathionine beta-synthase